MSHNGEIVRSATRGDRRKVYLAVSLVCLIGVLFLAACTSSPDFDQPPEISYGEDTCERCLMIINEARFAAAYVTPDGETRRFDDIGGMLAHDQEVGEDVAVFWVHDFVTEDWLKAGDAFFVKSDDQHTPMGFGIIAFAGRDQAESWVAENNGVVMTFADLRAGDEDMEHTEDQDG